MFRLGLHSNSAGCMCVCWPNTWLNQVDHTHNCVCDNHTSSFFLSLSFVVDLSFTCYEHRTLPIFSLLFARLVSPVLSICNTILQQNTHNNHGQTSKNTLNHACSCSTSNTSKTKTWQFKWVLPMDRWQATQLNLLIYTMNTTIQSILLSPAEPNRGPQTNVCKDFN